MIDEIVSLPESVVLGIKQFINDKGLKSQPLLRDGIFALLELATKLIYDILFMIMRKIQIH